MLAVLPSKLPFCAYSICVDEVAVEGEIFPSLVSGASPVLYGFCMEHASVLEIKSENDLLALHRQLEAGTIHRGSVCAVWLIMDNGVDLYHRGCSNEPQHTLKHTSFGTIAQHSISMVSLHAASSLQSNLVVLS